MTVRVPDGWTRGLLALLMAVPLSSAVITPSAGQSAGGAVLGSGGLSSGNTETITVGKVHHMDDCWEGPGGGAAFLQVKLKGYWTNVAEGPYKYDKWCAEDDPAYAYYIPGLKWKPPDPGRYRMRVYFGVDDTQYVYELVVKPKPGRSAPFRGVRYFRWPGGGDPRYRAVRFSNGGSRVQVMWTNDGPGACFTGYRSGATFTGREVTFTAGSRRVSYSQQELLAGVRFNPPNWVKVTARKAWSSSECR